MKLGESARYCKRISASLANSGTADSTTAVPRGDSKRMSAMSSRSRQMPKAGSSVTNSSASVAAAASSSMRTVTCACVDSASLVRHGHVSADHDLSRPTTSVSTSIVKAGCASRRGSGTARAVCADSARGGDLDLMVESPVPVQHPAQL